MSLNLENKKPPLKTPRALEEVETQNIQDTSASDQNDEAVTRALEMYLRQRALVSPTGLPRWVTW